MLALVIIINYYWFCFLCCIFLYRCHKISKNEAAFPDKNRLISQNDVNGVFVWLRHKKAPATKRLQMLDYCCAE